MENVIKIDHRGESLAFTMEVEQDGETIREPMTGQAIYNRAKAILVDHDVCVIQAERADTLSGVLKHISGIRAWGNIIPQVQFKLDHPHGVTL